MTKQHPARRARISLIAFACPFCGRKGQRFPLLALLHHQVRTRCAGCGMGIQSRLRGAAHLAFEIYLHVAVPLLGLWLLSDRALEALAVFVIVVWLPFMAVHGRSVKG